MVHCIKTSQSRIINVLAPVNEEMPENTCAKLNVALPSSIRMGFPCQSDSMHRAHDVCKGISNGKIPPFSYYCIYGVVILGDDGTSPADESKKMKRVQGRSRQFMGEGFCYLQYYYFVK